MTKTQSGLTMVEMAVVVIIIGLLIAGIFSGMTLYHNSRLAATYTQARAFSAAAEEFIGRYRALPGDMANAQSRMPLCDNNPAGSCRDGDGNNVVGSGNLQIWDAQGPGSGAEDETTLFWYHLAAAGLINSINIDQPMAAGTAWGQSHPAAPAGGGYHVRTMAGLTTDSSATEKMKGLFIRWQATPYQNANAGNIFVTSPQDALYIDRKFDDGAPLTGKVEARGTNTGIAANDGCRASQSAYIENGTDAACYMYFRIRETSGL